MSDKPRRDWKRKTCNSCFYNIQGCCRRFPPSAYGAMHQLASYSGNDTYPDYTQPSVGRDKACAEWVQKERP